MFRRLFRLEASCPRQVDDEMHDEIEAHIALGVEHLVARGASLEDAEATMRARLGSANAVPRLQASARQRSSRIWRRELLRTPFRDLIFAIRQARRAPLFSLGIVLSLGFGIGASAIVYSWTQGFILRPLPAVYEVNRLISARPDVAHGWGISLPELAEWRQQSRTTSGLAAFSYAIFSLAASSPHEDVRPAPLYGLFVSGNYFSLLGVTPAHGRLFDDRDDREGAEPVAVVSDYAWRTQLAADPDAVGRMVQVDGRAVRIVGIAPPNFGGTLSVVREDLYLTLSARPQLLPADAGLWKQRDWRWVDVIGRLKPGATLAQADADFKAIAARQAERFSENAGRGARAIPLDLGTGESLGPLFYMLNGLTLLVVLLICSNVANLLLTRATTRDREFAVRLSLGAGRGRIVWQLMTESAALAAVGALLGLLLTFGFNGALGPSLIPRMSIGIAPQREMDWRFVLVVMGVTSGCVLAFGLAPALIASRIGVLDALKNGSRGSSQSRASTRTLLVVLQFAFAMCTLVATALFLEHDRDVRQMDIGFRPDNVLLVQTEMAFDGHDDLRRWAKAIDDAAERARRVPGVRATAVGSYVPLGIVGFHRQFISVPGHATGSGHPGLEYVSSVGPGYFDVMGIDILSGRAISIADVPGRPLVAVVSQSFVQRYFDGAPALGKTFLLEGKPHVIVGVAKNTRWDYREFEHEDLPMVYFSWKQTPLPFITIHAKTEGDPMSVSPAVLSAIGEVLPNLTTLPVMSLNEYITVPFVISRSIFKVAGVLSTVALILASMGLFSVISYGVSLRTREIGIRMALGAPRHSVVALFLGGAAQMIVYGTAAGIVVSILLTTLMRTALPQLPPGTFREFLVPALILGCAAFAAGFIPSRRAATVDPARTLRSE